MPRTSPGPWAIRAAAAWLAPPGSGPSGGRLAVIVTDAAGPANAIPATAMPVNAMPVNAMPANAMPAAASRGGPQ